MRKRYYDLNMQPGIIIIIIIIIIIGRKALIVLKFSSYCPLVLLVYVSWDKGKTLGCEEFSVVRSGLLGVCCGQVAKHLG
jgi:hypothetical protein